jgi:hypothetical protein
MRKHTHFIYTTVVLLMVISTAAAKAQLSGWYVPPPGPRPEDIANAERLRREAEAEREQIAARKALADWYAKYVPRDPWRVINGITNFAKGQDWVEFSGKVIEVQHTGVRVRGWYGFPGATHVGTKEFFIRNYPYDVAEEEQVGGLYFAAQDSTSHTYTTTMGTSRTIHSLDYGIVSEPPEYARPKPVDPLVAAVAAQRKKAEQDARLLKYQLDLAAKDDPYGLFRIGQRYATGDGVEKDLQKARVLLIKSADQGNTEAAETLKKLPQN